MRQWKTSNEQTVSAWANTPKPTRLDKGAPISGMSAIRLGVDEHLRTRKLDRVCEELK